MLAAAPLLRRELLWALVLTWLCVLARTLVFLLYPYASFDSDQAVVGLMAKHLSEGEALPLYLYGYSYMLAVQSWFAVPFFWIAGPTAAALKASLITTNLIVATMLVVGLVRGGGLRPGFAAVAAVFFSLVPPDTSASIVDASGGSVEPFLWILILWFVRQKPFVFGLVLAVGFLNREFTVYAVPVLIAGQLWTRTLFTRDVLRGWMLSLVAFAAVWQGVQLATPYADLDGPGTRGTASTVSAPLDNLTARMQVDIAATPARVWRLLTGEVRTLLGGRAVVQIATQGRNWLGWAFAAFGLLACARVMWLWWTGPRPVHEAGLGWYLLGVGVMAVLGYALTRPADDVTPRYLLLTLFIPVGLTAAWLSLEPVRHVRHAVVAFALVCAAVSGIDNWRQFDRFASGRTGDGMQPIIAALDARGITLAEAPHWRAYKITFLTNERIIVASTDQVRIRAYRLLADAAGPGIARLQSEPCEGPLVEGWYICKEGGPDFRLPIKPVN